MGTCTSSSTHRSTINIVPTKSLASYFPISSSQSTDYLTPRKVEQVHGFREKILKVLVTGLSNSGKTTFFRQIKYIEDGFNNDVEERRLYRNAVLLNLLTPLVIIIKQAKILFDVDFTTEPSVSLIIKTYARFKKEDPEESESLSARLIITPDLRKSILKFCQQKSFKLILLERFKLNISNEFEYFLERLKNDPMFGSFSEWLPTVDDLLHSRTASMENSSVKFDREGVKYMVVDDDSKQLIRNNRRLVEQMDTIVYLFDMSCYDQMNSFIEGKYDFTESVKNWSRTVNSTTFEKTWIILILNKIDVFKLKFKTLKKHITPNFKVNSPPPYPEFDDKECSQSIAWVETVLLDQVELEKKKQQVRTYVLNSLDFKQVKDTFELILSFLENAGAFSDV